MNDKYYAGEHDVDDGVDTHVDVVQIGSVRLFGVV